jgi:hypothetical protein
VPPATLGAEAIVRIWERGRREHDIDRALTILAVLEQRSRDELAHLSLESRDASLLAWRARLFGDTMAGYAVCPRCSCGFDVSLTAASPAEPAVERTRYDVPGTGRTVRLPTSADLAAAAGCDSVDAARRMLVRRLIADADDATAVFDDAATDGVLAAAAAVLDRLAELSAAAVAMACVDCGHRWTLELDVAGFFWRELEILATRLLRDVDVLARRYGWSEREILELSAARRHYYVELAS